MIYLIPSCRTVVKRLLDNDSNNFYFYSRRIPVVGKHSRKIQSGCWSSGGNLLALGGKLDMFTVTV